MGNFNHKRGPRGQNGRVACSVFLAELAKKQPNAPNGKTRTITVVIARQNYYSVGEGKPCNVKCNQCQ